MRKRLTINSVILILMVSTLTNTLGWAFNDKVIAHELEHHYYATFFSADPQKHLDLHHALGDNGELDAATHLCLHAAGQYQPFFFNSSFLIAASIAEAVTLSAFVLTTIPESIPDSLFHPPRSVSSTPVS